MLVAPERSSAVLVMISSKSVSICNRSYARLVNSSRNRAFWRWYPHLMHSYRGLLEPRRSKLTQLKSTCWKNFIRMLSWSISSDFGAVRSWNVYCSLKNSLNPLFSGFKAVQGHRCWYPGKLVSSGCYDRQQVCLSATVLTLDELIRGKITIS